MPRDVRRVLTARAGPLGVRTVIGDLLAALPLQRPGDLPSLIAFATTVCLDPLDSQCQGGLDSMTHLRP